MDRREFIKGAIAAAIVPAFIGTAGGAESAGNMPYRTLGRTGAKVSLLGLGGYHIGRAASDDDAIRIVRTAIDNGVTFMDNCWDYNDGLSEVRMGNALKDGYRQKVFLMTKIDGREAKLAARQLDESLRRLQTDHIDLVQFHEIIRLSDPPRVFAKGGSFEALQSARKAGKVRFIGFTGHKHPDIHIKMLNAAYDRDHFLFDTVQMPLNIMDPHYYSFETRVLPQLVKHNVGVIGMKPLGGGVILRTKVATPAECLHYAMNLPTSVVVTGCDSMAVLRQALEAAFSFRPLSKEQVDALVKRTADLGKAGKYELYKTTHDFDGTYHNPQWLGEPPTKELTPS